MEHNIRVLINSAGEYGLNLNKSKTKILHVRGSEKVEKVGDYTVEEEVKYLQGWEKNMAKKGKEESKWSYFTD